MNLYDAQCPNCHHAFKINDEQLAIKKGYVRCALCKTIFSAAEQLQQKSLLATSDSKLTPPVAQPIENLESSEILLFDDNSGLDESGNIIIEKTKEPILAFTKDKSTSNLHRYESNDNAFAIIEDFDTLNKPIASKSANLLIKDEIDSEQAITNSETSWLESLLAEANEKEDFQDGASKAKRYGKPAFDTDIFDQIEIVEDKEISADLASYQQKIDQRLSQQISSQKIIDTKSKNMGIVWILGSVILSLGLVAQYVIFNIDSLVTSKFSQARLSKFCEGFSLPCNLPLADTGLIETQTLKLSSSPKHLAQTDLVFTLTNNTDSNIVYPTLKISLRSGNTIQAQTLVLPKDYLEVGNNYLMPHQVKPIKLRINYPKSKIEQANVELMY